MKNCSICETQGEKGINVLQSFLCNTCLDKISSTKVDDPGYGEIVQGIRKVWTTNEIAK